MQLSCIFARLHVIVTLKLIENLHQKTCTIRIYISRSLVYYLSILF